MPRFRPLIVLLLTLSLIPLFLPSEKTQKAQISPHPIVKSPPSISDSTPSLQVPRPSLTSASQPHLTLPPLDHQPLLLQAQALEAKGRYRFATSRDTDIAPHLGGTWTTTADRARWHYHLRSAEAHSLNLGFSEFHLPNGAQLTLSDPSGKSAPLTFTASDNDPHQELWTPIFPGDQLALTLDLPKKLAPDLRLRLTKVNHGFRDKAPAKLLKAIGDSSSGSCNIDVICDPSDDPTFGPLVDLYRDQIRSVAAYTIGGIETCSGALINNTRNDLTPFFLTANHCEISTQNAPSVVVYWNFENASCRTPGSSNSGANGNGAITDFNTGAIFRATRSQSDFCLIELDDPVTPSFQPFYAGWDRSGDNPNSVIGIHHPGVSEKRISFEQDPTLTTNYYSNFSDFSGTHIRVADWDFGTTEGGSSGSPLFDDTGKIIGQLHGGDAACGNNLPDWYGRLSRSWTDGGTPATQLSNWLDPDNSATPSIIGINSDEILTVTGGSISEGDSGNTTIQATITLSRATSETVTVTLITEADSATSDDFTALSQVITFHPGETTQVIPISITGDTTPEEHETFLLRLLDSQGATSSSQVGKVTILNDDYILPVITSALSSGASANSAFEYRIIAQNTPTSFSITGQPNGMNIDSLTGVITWIPDALGTQTVSLIASNPAGTDTKNLTITIVSNLLATALDLTTSSTLSNSSPGWFSQTATTTDGVDAAQADPISDGGSASFSLQIDGPDLLDFQLKVSSEPGYDFLTIDLDGIEKESFSGEVDWQPAVLSIPPGPHTITFSYIKDSTTTGGADTAWLDSFTLASTTGRPAITSPRSLAIDTATPFSYPITSIAPNATFTVTNLPPGLSFDGNSTLSGSVATPGIYPIQIRAATATNEDTITLSLRVLIPVGPSVEITNLTWIREGASVWFGQEDVSFDGTDSARSGDISDSESSSISIQITGPDRMSFHWKVSSEEGFDGLAFLLDGQVVGGLPPISGEVDWTPVFVNIPSGAHTLTWEYSKDNAESTGLDIGWVDDIRLASGQRPLIWTSSQSLPAAIAGSTTRLPLEFINADSYTFSALPAWLTYLEESGELVGIPPTPGTYPITARATGAGETTTRTFSLIVGGRSPALSAALDQPDLITITNTAPSTAPWTVITDATATGGSLAQSGQIGDNQTSSLTLLVQGPGTLRFRWKVSSEDSFDFLSYTLDNTFLAQISGEAEWEEIEVPLTPGTHRITWTYTKDGSNFTGSDAGRLDRITLTGFAHFLTDSGLDHTEVLPTDDPDGNGFSLFHEYAFLQEPGSPATRDLLTFTTTPGTAQFHFLALPPNSGISYFLETSTTLSGPRWTRLPGTLQVTPLSESAQYSQATPFPSPDHKALFYRIRARFE